MISRFLLQQQQVPQVLIEDTLWQASQPFLNICDMLQAHHELQSQLNHALQQLFQLSYTLQAHAEQNSTHSQQLQLQAGVTSKVNQIRHYRNQPSAMSLKQLVICIQVAERLMLAHCEQELAQRARIVSETRATVRLPPFAQVSCLPAC